MLYLDKPLKAHGLLQAIARVNRVEDVCKEGDEMVVKVIAIDRATGKIRLSRRATLGESPEVVHNFRVVAPS